MESLSKLGTTQKNYSFLFQCTISQREEKELPDWTLSKPRRRNALVTTCWLALSSKKKRFKAIRAAIQNLKLKVKIEKQKSENYGASSYGKLKLTTKGREGKER